MTTPCCVGTWVRTCGWRIRTPDRPILTPTPRLPRSRTPPLPNEIDCAAVGRAINKTSRTPSADWVRTFMETHRIKGKVVPTGLKKPTSQVDPAADSLPLIHSARLNCEPPRYDFAAYWGSMNVASERGQFATQFTRANGPACRVSVKKKMDRSPITLSVQRRSLKMKRFSCAASLPICHKLPANAGQNHRYGRFKTSQIFDFTSENLSADSELRPTEPAKVELKSARRI